MVIGDILELLSLSLELKVYLELWNEFSNGLGVWNAEWVGTTQLPRWRQTDEATVCMDIYLKLTTLRKMKEAISIVKCLDAKYA